MFSDEVKEDFYHCLKCGMCQSVCPTFKVIRKEFYAPRGRVQIIKHYLEGDLQLSRNFNEAINSCILCDACSTQCPSGVRINRLFRNMRLELANSSGIPLRKKLIFATLSNHRRLKAVTKIARIGQQAVNALRNSWKVGNIPLSRFPRFNKLPFRERFNGIVMPKGKRIGRILYFTGCATDLIYEDIGYSVIKILASLGFEILIPLEQVCCAAPIFLSGAGEQALTNILHNLALLDRNDIDAIAVDCATCGAALKKEIPHLLHDLGLDTEKADRVSQKVKSISQIVADNIHALEVDDSFSGKETFVTFHDPCHLARGMGISLEPRKILNHIGGIRFVEMEGSAECCGGGGSYQFEYPAISAGITSRKTNNILATGASIVGTECPGCLMTINGSLVDDRVHAFHTAQIIADRLRSTGSAY